MIGSSWRSTALRWSLATFVLWAIAVSLLGVRAYRAAIAGQGILEPYASLGREELADTDVDQLEIDLREAAIELNAAHDDLRHPLLLPIRVLPTVGTQVTVAAEVAGASADLAEAGGSVLEAAASLRDDDAARRPATLASVADDLEIVASLADREGLRHDGALLAPLRRGRDRLVDLLDEVADPAARGAVVADALSSLLGGRRYLLLGANNSEMRLASGMHLSVGVVETDGGEVSIREFAPADDFDPIAGATLLDADVAENWGFLGPEDDFRKLGYSARFDEHVGPQALELWRAATGEQLDGAVQLDAVALAEMVDVVGPIELDGEIFDRDATLDYLLIDQYAEFDHVDTDLETLAARRDRLGDLAGLVSLRLFAFDAEPTELLGLMADLVEGRHLMVYGADPIEQAGWEAVDATGRIAGDEIGVSWLNTGASKLDPYVDVDVEVDIERLPSGNRRVEVAVTTTNRATPDLPRYTLGPWPALELDGPGVYAGRLAFIVPNGVVDAELAPGVRADVFAPDGEVLLIASRPLRVGPGETFRTHLTFELLETVESMEVVPSTRVPAVAWSWPGGAGDDRTPLTISLTE